MKQRVRQSQIHSPCPRASASSVLTGRRPVRSRRSATLSFGRHAPRAARVQRAPGVAWYPVATSYDPPVSLGLCGGMSWTGGTQFIASVFHPVDEMVDEMARTPTPKPLSVSSCLRELRFNRPEARPVAQERAPPAVWVSRVGPIRVPCVKPVRTPRAEGGAGTSRVRPSASGA